MFFKKKTEIEKSLRNRGYVRPSLSSIFSDISEYHTKLLKDEGVTDDDIKWWWNLDDKQRDEIKQSNQQQILSANIYFSTTIGMSFKEVMCEVRKKFIVYHDFPIDHGHFEATKEQGFGPDDYALPWELSARVGKYVMEKALKDHLSFQEELKGFSTVNAFLRHKIKKGEIGIINY